MALTHLVIVTGLSGSGKSKALNFLEDLGYFCIDNMPTVLIKKFLELYTQESIKLERVALGIDIREKDLFYNIDEIFEEIKRYKVPFDIIFLEASTEVLVRRFKETRRKHPITKYTELVDNIEYEREILAPLKRKATIIIDTSYTTINQLKEVLYQNLKKHETEFNIQLQFISFGYKYGLPPSADFIFDTRYLPNPFYDEKLKQKTGLEEEIKKYVIDNEVGHKTLQLLEAYLDYIVEKISAERRPYIIICFGCTGGKHRSVVLAEHFKEHFRKKGLIATTMHRDIGKE